MKQSIILAAMAVAILAGGCATQTTSTSSGFSTDTLKDGAEFSYKSEEALKGYNAFYIKSVTAKAQDDAQPLNETDIAALEFAFEDAFKAAMDDSYQFATGPGPKTLEVDTVIGEVMHAKPTFSPTANNPADTMNTLGDDTTAAIPNAPIHGSGICVCQLHLKVDFYDSESGELIASFSDAGFGAGVEIDVNGKTSWSRVSTAMNYWCQDIKGELVKLTH